MKFEPNEYFTENPPFRRRILIGFVVWTTLALVTAGRNHLTYHRLGYDVPISTTLVSSFVDFYLWGAASMLIFRLCLKFPVERPQMGRHFLLYLCLGVLMTFSLAVVSVPIFLFLTGGDFAEFRNIFQSIVFSPWNLYQGFFTFWGIVVVGHAIDFNRRAREKENRLRNLAVQLADAKLNALKMQLQPHFLFNTLNSIASLLRRDADKAEQMIAYLGEFLRMTLSASNENLTTLEKELHFLQTYLKIEKIRFQDKLITVFRVDPDTLSLRLPTLITQPIVENSIRHGFRDKSENCVLEIESIMINDRLLVRILDNGEGVSKAITENETGGLGLRNTEQRLKETYGDDFRLDFKIKESAGALVEIEIPAGKR